MKAFLLTFRLFIQDRDGLSFRAIASLSARLPISEHLKQKIAEIREQVNHYLDGCSLVVIDGHTVSRRTLLETWMYGELAHLNPDRRATLRLWRVADDVRPIFSRSLRLLSFTSHRRFSGSDELPLRSLRGAEVNRYCRAFRPAPRSRRIDSIRAL